MNSQNSTSKREPYWVNVLQLAALGSLTLASWQAWSHGQGQPGQGLSEGSWMAWSAFALLFFGVALPALMGIADSSRGPVVSVAALMAVAGFAALHIAPTERTMGLIQRIFYFHLGSAAAGAVALIAAFVANILYLARRAAKWDWLAVACVEAALASVTVMLVTGPIWAHPVWGIWWTWDARLTTTFILWVLYVAYLLLRTLVEEPQRRATVSAVFGIFAFLDAPLVYVSNRLWRTQHPAPVLAGGQNSGLDPMMFRVWLVCFIAMLALVILIVHQRYRLEELRYEAEELSLRSQAASASRSA